MCRVCAGAVFLLLTLVVCGQATGSDVRAVPCIIGAPGQTGESAIILDQVSQGLSEFEIQVLLLDPAIGEITAVKFPSWAGLNSKSGVPSDSVTLKAVDTGKRINPGDKEVLLATLTLRGDSPGTSVVQVRVLGTKDEGGVFYSLPGRNGTLTVMQSPVSPGESGVPTPPVPSTTPITTIPTVVVPTSTLPPITTSLPTFVIPTEPIPPITPLFTTVPTVVVPTTMLPTITPPLPTSVIPTEPVPSGTPQFTTTPTVVLPTATTTSVTPWSPDGETTPVPTPSPGINGDEPDSGAGRDTPLATRGALCIDSIPEGALIIVDGKEEGMTPACITLEGGIHLLRMSTSDGYSWEGFMSVIAGQTLTLPAIHLEKPRTYVISVSAGPYGSVYPSGSVEVMEGEDAEFYFTPNPGYRLDGVWIDGVSQEPSSVVSFASVSENHVLSGTFSKIPPPLAYFSSNVTEGYAPLAVEFQDQSRGEVSAVHWDFGDGTASEDASPVHVYEMAGTYTVILDVCGGGGCNTSHKDDFISVRLRDPLVANFSANVTSGEVPLTVQFTDLSNGNPDSWTWDFGDGTFSADPSPVHVYENPGFYTVRLAVANEHSSATFEEVDMVNATHAVIGGSIGYIMIQCPLEGAQIYLDNVLQGTIQNGTLTVPVYVTGTPFNTIRVKDGGFLLYSGPVKAYPSENQTVILVIPSINTRSLNTTAPRFQVPNLLGNATASLPSMMKQ